MGFFGSLGRALGIGKGDAIEQLVAQHGSAVNDEVAKAGSKLPGSDGVLSYGGYLPNDERNRLLQGPTKWTTFTNTVNASIVATGVRYSCNLIAGTEWHCEPNESGGKDADRGVDIITQGLLRAPMPKPWSAVVKKTSMYRFLGFSLHAWATRTRDSDGMVVFANIEHRPQYTIERWVKPDETKPWTGVVQRTRSGQTYDIARNQLFYAVDDTLTDNPDGVGILRHVVELAELLGVYQGLEAGAFQGDLGGVPIGRLPEAELIKTFPDPVKRAEYTAAFEGFLRDRVRDPRKLQYLLLDSAIYKGADPNVISTIQKWAVEILKSETANLPAINQSIGRIQLEIARVLGIEWALMGDGEGARAVHEDKTGMFAALLQATIDEIAAFATNDLARVLVARNGLDPETATPRLVADPISIDSIVEVSRMLVNLQLAGLQRNDPARNAMRKRGRLPPEPEPTAAELGMLPRNEAPVDDVVDGDEVGPTGAVPGAKPVATKTGSSDAKVNDLGDTSPNAPTNAAPKGKP